MAETGPFAHPRPYPTFLLGALWAFELTGFAVSFEWLRWLTAAGLVVFVAYALIAGRWQIRLVALILGLCIAALCVAFGGWDAIWHGVQRATIFVPFLCTIVLLRACAEQRPEIAAAREMFTSLDRRRRGGGILIGAHILGSVLIVGAFALLAPILGRDAAESERRQVALAAMRGMCLAVLWSPFFVAMGFTSSYLPAVELWQIMPVGLLLAAIGILVAYLIFDREAGLGSLARVLRSLAPVMPSVAVAALTVALLTGLTRLTTVEALIIGMPVLCLPVLAAMGGGALKTAMRTTREGLGNLGPELCLMTFAMTLGVVLETTLPQTGVLPWLRGLALSPPAVIGVVAGGITLAAFLTIHPIVSGTVLLVLFTSFPTGVADLVLMQCVLVGWSLGTMISVSSVSVATSSAMFRTAPEKLVTRGNIGLAVVLVTLSVVILSGLNHVLNG
jgi:hypothetical protein